MHMSSAHRSDNGDTPFEPTNASAALPPPDTKRWVVRRRKAAVVQAVHTGVITLQEACQRYNLSVEEFVAWQRAIERFGVPGLRSTRVQIYRDTDAARGGGRRARLRPVGEGNTSRLSVLHRP
jgi:hypothetical protein